MQPEKAFPNVAALLQHERNIALAPVSVPVTSTKRKRSISAFRNRRRAKDLNALELKAVQLAMEFQRNSEDVGKRRDVMLPRAEVQDAAIIGLAEGVRCVQDSIRRLERLVMGASETGAGRPYLVQSARRAG